VIGLNPRAERLILPGLAASPRARIAAVCSRDPAKASRIAGTLDGVRPFSSPEALLASGLIDAVYVNTPLDTHADLCHAAIRAGIAVICEKPLAPTTAQSAALAEAAERAGVRTAVNFTYRSVAAFRMTERWLDQRQPHAPPADPLLHARFELLQGHNFLPDFPRASALLDSGCHLFDTLAALLDRAGAGAIHEVCGSPVSTALPGPAPDHGWSFLARTERGLVVPALFTRQALGWRNGLRWTLSGAAEAIGVETDGADLRVRTATAGDGAPYGQWRPVPPPADLAADDARFPAFHMDRLVGAARGEERFPTFADAAFTNRLAEALARSARETRWISLDTPRATRRVGA
jgi:predicted dehydrogenase